MFDAGLLLVGAPLLLAGVLVSSVQCAKRKQDEKDLPKAPEKKGIVDTHDPNYQTLAAVGANDQVFGDDKKKDGDEKKEGGPKEPEKKGVAETHDPNYQTLANVGQNETVFGKDKKDEKGAAHTYDPNYQTLANLGKNDAVFGADKKAGGGEKKAETPKKK
ncbi:hypothetical protein M3Y99_00248400 [Aphelenchoides fujianensis]|nr:hypothetical protein M3Y99_00248400 [Aphelenchoides fujianensis]